MNQLSSLIRHNLPAKILSVLAAAVLWVFVMNDQNPSINSTFTVPVRMVNVPDNYMVTASEKEVRLKVRAPRSLLASYNVEDFDAYVDLSGVEEGKSTLKILTVVPSGFELLDMSDETVDVTLEEMIAKHVNVNINTVGAVAPDMVVTSVLPDSMTMQVKGPRSIVDRVVNITGSINLADNIDDFRTTADISPLDSDGNFVEGVKMEKRSIGVAVDLSKVQHKKMVSLHPVAAGELPDGLVLDGVRVEPSKVEISGDEKAINSVETLNTMPVDLSKIDGSIVLDVELKLPEGISVSNKSVKVSINVKKQ